MEMKEIVKKVMTALDLDKLTTMRGVAGDEQVLSITPAQLVAVVEQLIENGVWHLSTITCLQKETFLMLYHFWCYGNLTLKIELAADDLRVHSICPLIPGAEYYEREVHEMYGIEFIGFSDPQPLLLPDTWKGGYPMRKEDSPPVQKNEEDPSHETQGGIS